jgi:hypothetical protein
VERDPDLRALSDTMECAESRGNRNRQSKDSGDMVAYRYV